MWHELARRPIRKRKMKAKRLGDTPVQQTIVLVFDKEDEFVSQLQQFADENHLKGSSFTGIGAFREATLGFFERESLNYKEITIGEQVEVLSLVGNIALDEDGPKIHAHVVVGDQNGRAMGGHVLQATVWPTLELVITESSQSMQRRTDSETGLALIDLETEDRPVRTGI